MYERLVRRYPTAQSLASARLPAVERMIGTLGLPERARRLKAMARALSATSSMPHTDRKTLLALPGVGDYVADAVEAFVYDREVCTLDANVVRFLGRFYGIPINGEARRSKHTRVTADRFIHGAPPRELNLAILDHCALTCAPRKPKCAQCVIAKWCQTGKAAVYPES